MSLEDRFEVLKEIGDGSFGSVVLARVRTAGANVARRGTVVSNCYIWRLPGLETEAG
jgi:meiosis induction protein kinase IME2/SME1